MPNPFETNGMFSWFELMTSDIEGAKKFYSEVVGWTFEADKNNPAYTLVKAPGVEHPMAGIYDRRKMMIENPEAVPPHWGSYITVTDIAAAVEKVEKLGGSVIVPATVIPKVGTFSVIKDPQGAVISLMEYNMSV